MTTGAMRPTRASTSSSACSRRRSRDATVSTRRRTSSRIDRSGTKTPCEQEYKVGLGYGQGRYLNTAWTDEYFYKSNRIGDFYDKLAAIQQMTTSSGRFVRDFSDLFDRRAYSLGYLRVYLDPMVQRWSALVTGDFTGYRSHVVTDPDTSERYVRYTPLFDEEKDGASVRQWLDQYPEIRAVVVVLAAIHVVGLRAGELVVDQR